MNGRDYIVFAKKFFEDVIGTVTAKNADYADPDGTGDAFANLRMCEVLGICSTEMGILVRMFDKFCRARTLIVNGEETARVKGEGLCEIARDMTGYAVLLTAIVEEKRFAPETWIAANEAALAQWKQISEVSQ